MSLVVFKDATLLDCTGSEPKYPATVFIENNIIREVADGNATIPSGAETIYCRGRTLMPGLIDAHVHISCFQSDVNEQIRQNLPSIFVMKCLKVFEDTLMQGFTTALDAGGADAGYKIAQAQGLVKGPRLQVCGHQLSQTGGNGDIRLPAELNPSLGHYFDLGIVVDGADAVRKAAREELRRGADYVKVMAAGGCSSPTDEPDDAHFSLDELRAAVDAAEAAGKTCIGHCYSPKSMQRCAMAGVHRVEHGNFMDEETARILKEHNVIYCPTISTYDIMSRRGEEFGLPNYFLRKMKLAGERGLGALELAVKTGLVIASGSDMFGPGHAYKALELELKSRVMGPLNAILSATKVNSEVMKIDSKVGTVEEGKLADLIVLDENPLENINVLQNRDKIPAIMQDGKFVKYEL